MGEVLTVKIGDREGWKRCPGYFEWHDGGLKMQGEVKNHKVEASVEYASDENDFVKVLNELKNAWNDSVKKVLKAKK